MKNDWDAFVLSARNSHFMFLRDYMDYHRDRFQDFSLMIYDEERLVAILPGNKKGESYYSHQGLTFGGFLVGNNIKTEFMLSIFETTFHFLRENYFKKIIYKVMPYIYHKMPVQEDLYALFLHNATLMRRDVSSAILLKNKNAYQEQRKRAIKRAQKAGIRVQQSSNFQGYWGLLTDVLERNHQALPVHMLGEIEYLAGQFPNNIKLFEAYDQDELLAGTVVYETDVVAHTQYLASSENGRKQGALDYIIDYLISNFYSSKDYFDFGISTEDQGRILNAGLIAQKEGFGARAIVHDFYEIIL